MKLFMRPQTLTGKPLKGQVHSSPNLLYLWLIVHAQIKVNSY